MPNNLDKQYTDLLKDILENGTEKKDRTGTGTISVFGRQIRHKMSEGFPLLTTKKMPFKTIVTELLWFLRGDTNIKFLVDNDCHIWDGDAYKNYRMNVQEYEKLPNSNDVKSMKMILDSQGNSHPFSVPFNKEEFINKIKTDDEFAKTWGELGPIYGKQWRQWNVKPTFNPETGEMFIGNMWVDQIQNLINDLKTNPDSRRLMVNAWNVGELDQMVLPPCHYGFQVYTRELSDEEVIEYHYKHNQPNDKWKKDGDSYYYFVEKSNMWFEHSGSDILFGMRPNCPKRAISLMWNQRSVDTFLGLPFNIASYGLLLEIIAEIVNMVPDELIGNLGDVHLYSNHIEQAKEQIGRELTDEERLELHNFVYIPFRTREPFPLPKLTINTEFWNPGTEDGCGMGAGTYTDNIGALISGFEITDFQIENYQSHPTIKAPLSN